MYDVRASDGFRFTYDFERDGWSITQSDEEGEWEETHFVQSWAKNRTAWAEGCFANDLRAMTATPTDTITRCIATGRDEYTLTPPVIPS
jgi:hypothetical protein